MANSRLCSIPDCSKKHFGRGWCNAHYKRFLRHGDPMGGGTSIGDAHLFYEEVVLTYNGDDCLLWPFACDSHGYGRLNREGRIVTVSRIVCEEEHGAPPTPEHDAAHSCGKGHEGCVTKGHLSWKTRAENFADKLIHGTHNRGERNAIAKLSDAQVLEIHSLKSQMTQREIATRFGVALQTVSAIHRGKSWRHLLPA